MKFLTSLLLGGSLLLSSAPVRASTVDEHINLWDSLEQAGVNIVLNDVEFCGETGVAGAYISSMKTLVVCQDNASPLSSRQVYWTQNDLDTLRHEAHHVVQDCIVGGLGDGDAGPLFDTKDKLIDFVDDILTAEQVDSIISNYREKGASNGVIIMEVEAFAVAAGVSPDKIAEAITEVCNV